MQAFPGQLSHPEPETLSPLDPSNEARVLWLAELIGPTWAVVEKLAFAIRTGTSLPSESRCSTIMSHETLFCSA